MNSLTHVAGTFVIHADASFLNGAGLGGGEDRNVTIPKTLQDGKFKVPYVSSQSWKRWLRTTLIEETGWKPSELRSIKDSEKGTTSKISGELDPVGYAEDDLFGFMRAQEGQGKKGKQDNQTVDEPDVEEEIAVEGKRAKSNTKSVMRTSPFAASLLVSIRKKGWQGRDEGFVHLKEGTPLPYTTEFYTTHLQAIFCLAHARVGLFCNEGDRIELDEPFVKKYLGTGQIIKSGNNYEIANAGESRRQRTGELLKALAVLRGGAKQAAFGTDVAPKSLILAGLSCGNPIFNQLFDDEPEKGLRMKVAAIKEVLSDYADRIVTPVAIGLRTGYLANEEEVRQLDGKHVFPRGTVEVVVKTPRQAAELIASKL